MTHTSFSRILIQPLIGLLSFLIVSTNILLCGLAIHGVALLRCLLRKPESWARPYYDGCYRIWVNVCRVWFQRVLNVTWHLDDWQPPSDQHWHLVIANHRSWVDVFVLLTQLEGRVPLPRIFMKHTLGWLPLLGTATKLMGFPHVKRYDKAALAKRPDLASVDQLTTEQACAPLKVAPSTILTFAEGTRFSAAKHAAQASPYHHLLKPKAGGAWMVMQAMPEHIKTITDVTIFYEGRVPSYWDLLCGRATTAYVKVRDIELPTSDHDDLALRDKAAFYQWFNGYWQRKDDAMVAHIKKCSKLEMSQKDTIKKGNSLQS